MTSRRGRERAGRLAESAAAWLLRLKGYRILARRYATPVGEIDLVARKGELVLFVEVKRRTHAATALEALLPRQQRRIARAAALFPALWSKRTKRRGWCGEARRFAPRGRRGMQGTC